LETELSRLADARRRLEAALEALWFERTRGSLADPLLTPLALLTARVARSQRARIEALPAPPVPVVVIGNLVVGGAGKTPLVTATVHALAGRGWRPGILASGYGAQREDARLVTPGDAPEQAGDEALLLATATGRPTAVARRRAEALALLLRTHPDVDVVVSDDGLQHAALPRSIEIAVFDRRGIGNGRLLPAGPLREPLAHLAGMDALAINGDLRAKPWADSDAAGTGALAALPRFHFRVVPERFVRVDGSLAPLSPEAFRAKVERARAEIRATPWATPTTTRASAAAATPSSAAAAAPGWAEPAPRPPSESAVLLAAVAGIGEPQRLFDTLTSLGLEPALRLAPGDHRTLDAPELQALPARFVVMTSKDAVKCRAWADERCWALEVSAQPDPAFINWLDTRLREA
jgi:tetraacyldisaccharide 4'-kinase